MEALLIKNGRVLDPASDLDQKLDILVVWGKIKEMAPEIKVDDSFLKERMMVIDATNKIITPGLIDVHVHAREPGEEYKETIRTVSRAAASGGFTTIICAPNTIPPIDNPWRVKRIIERARKKSLVNFFTYACITKGMKGKKVVNVEGIKREGAVGLTDDGFPVRDIKVMKEAAKLAKEFSLPICPHCEEVKGPFLLEAKLIKRYVRYVLRKIPTHFHFFHLSLKESVRLVAEAKREGLPVSAEATPHHFTLSEREKMGEKINPNFLMNPPLRSLEDVAAIREGLRENVIDVIASDHAPHTKKEKNSQHPPLGVIGLETTLGLVLTHLVKSKILSLKEAIRKMTINPARIFGIEGGRLGIGLPADITIIDPDWEWTVKPNLFESKGRNCPFAGWRLWGKAVMTIVRGEVIMSRMEKIKGRFIPKDLKKS